MQLYIYAINIATLTASSTPKSHKHHTFSLNPELLTATISINVAFSDKRSR